MVLLSLGLLLASAPAWAQSPPSPAPYPPQPYPPQPYPAQPYPAQPYPPPAAPPVYYAPPPVWQAPAPSYHFELQPRWGLLSAGIVIFGVSWTSNAVAAYLADYGYLAIPIAGPIVVAKQYDDRYCNTPNSCSAATVSGNRMVVGVLVFDALIQAGGAAMVLVGALTKQRVRVMDRPPRVAVLPTAQAGGAGVAAFGHF
jgi:hypothetical protein